MRLGPLRVARAEPGCPALDRPLRVRPRLSLVREGVPMTRVRHVEGSLSLDQVDIQSDTAIGAVVVEAHGRPSACVRLTPKALASGVLVGRYSRCQLHQEAATSTPLVSRVHLCLLLDETGLWAIDLASRNGSVIDGERFRSRRLGPEAPIELAESLRVRWVAA